MSFPLPANLWYYDLVRLARRGRSNLVRVCYVLALFAILAAVYYNMQPRYQDMRDGNAKVAERFSIAILLLQNIAVVVLTPIYVAAGIQEERDKGTLALLFTTNLTTWEIVLGKWLSRTGHVGGIMLSSLPVLSFVQLWGGIDMPMIAANFWNTGCLLLTVGAFSLAVAMKTTSLLGAVGKTYLILAALPLCCCGPHQFFTGRMVLLLTPFGDGPNNYAAMWMVAGMMTFVHGMAICWFLSRAAAALEATRDDSTPRVFVDARSLEFKRTRYWGLPPITENVVTWKERYLDANYGKAFPLMLLPIVVCVCLTDFSLWSGQQGGRAASARVDLAFVLQFLMLGGFLFFLVLVALRLTGCIVRERQQQTLETLLTLPIAPLELLDQKMRGAILRYWHWLLVFGTAWLYLAILGPGRHSDGFLLLFVLTVHLTFFAALGLFLSVHCLSSVAAHVTFAVLGLLLFAGIPLMLLLAGASEDVWRFQRGVNPLHAWITITDSWCRLGRPTATQEIIECTLTYAAAALVLWMRTCRRFALAPL